MNQYSQLLYFLKQLAEAHPMVNTVTKGLAQNIDLEKANIFPLVHITIDEAGFKNGQTIGFNVTLECLTERLLNKKVVDNKFWRQDNEVDNHNVTLAILNYMWTSIFRDWNNNDMTTSDEPTITKIEFAKGNILDGWAMTFEVEVPNTALTLCDITFEDIEAVVSAGTGGTVKPGVGTFTVLYGSNNAYYAEPSSGYRFLRWLYNGIESLINPIAIKAVYSYTLVANFIKQWQVTTSVNGAGTITPSSGLTDEGNITIQVTVTNPLVDEFEKIEVTPDGEALQTFYTNPLTWALNKAVVIVGYVKAILQNFTLTVTKTGNGTIVPDVGDHVYQEGTEVTITATESDDYYYFDDNYLESVAVGNPYVWTVDGNKTLEARFLAWQAVQDVFSTAPITDGSNVVFPDKSGNANDLIISDSNIYTLKYPRSNNPRTGNYTGAIKTEFTIEGWVRNDAGISGESVFRWGLAYVTTQGTSNITVPSATTTNAVTTVANEFTTGVWKHIALTVKSADRQILYVDGVEVSNVAAKTFDLVATSVNMQLGGYAVPSQISYANIRAYTKALSASDILFRYQNKYNEAYNRVGTSITYLDLWGAWNFNHGSGFGKIYDIRNTTGSVRHDIDTSLHATFNDGWSTDDSIHTNIYLGCLKVSADYGVTWFYISKLYGDLVGFDPNTLGNLYTNYIIDNKPNSFCDVESKVRQKNSGLPDYNNFWYDSGGAAIKKSFSDFTSEVLNNQLFTDLSVSKKVSRHIITNVQLTSSGIRNIINYGENNTSDIFIIGDSESSGYPGLAGSIRAIESSRFCNYIGEGGKHSYQLFDGWLTYNPNNGAWRSYTDEARYPSNPEIWTGYTVDNNDFYDILTSDKSWIKKHILVTMWGTNNPTILYPTAPDVNQIHYRLLSDNGLILNKHQNNRFISFFHFEYRLFDKTRYESDYSLFETYTNSINGIPFNPRLIIEQIYNALYNNDISGVRCLVRANSINAKESNAHPKGFIRQVGGDWLIYTIRKNTGVTGNMLSGNIYSWMKLSCSTPNTIVNIDGVNYDIYNPYIGVVSLTDGWIVDDPDYFPSSSRTDAIHTSTTFRYFIWCEVLSILEDNNW